MNTKGHLKKVVTMSLATVLVLGVATSAFADSKGKGNNNDDDNSSDNGRNTRIEYKGNANNQTKGTPSNNNSLSINNSSINNSVINNFNIALSFNDVKGADVEWAVKNIASLASRKVFDGYQDGTFQPRKEISHIEAITAAVRLMGLEDKAKAAMNTQLNFKDAKQVPAWAVGYVAVAAENDLFLETDNAVQAEKPADRMWATILLVKALKLDSQAKAAMNAHLTFKDADKIPAGAVGYIKVALDKGLINGYEDNTFRPDRAVTRAELAALLDRTGDLIPDNGTISGKVSAAVTNNTVTVVSNGASLQVPIDPSAFIFRDGVRIAASALQVGDELKIRTYNNTAIFIEVTKNGTQQPPQQNTFTVTGTVYNTVVNQGQLVQVTINQSIVTNGTTVVQQVTYPVAANVTITPNGSQLLANQNVELKGTNNIVSAITLK